MSVGRRVRQVSNHEHLPLRQREGQNHDDALFAGASMLFLALLLVIGGHVGGRLEVVIGGTLLGSAGAFSVYRCRSQLSWLRVLRVAAWLFLTFGVVLTGKGIASYVIGYRAISYWPVSSNAGSSFVLAGACLLALGTICAVLSLVLKRILPGG
jgi:hypothetical protein